MLNALKSGAVTEVAETVRTVNSGGALSERPSTTADGRSESAPASYRRFRLA